MKKIVAFIISLLFLLNLSACGKESFTQLHSSMKPSISDVADNTDTSEQDISTSVTTIPQTTVPTSSSFASAGLEYEINDDTTCTITGIGSCTDKDVYIPEYIDGYMVTAIGYQAFYMCAANRVYIPETVQTIGEFAFESCENLCYVEIPNSVTSIGVAAFKNCRSLTLIEIPDSVTSIGEYAFYACTMLCMIEIPGSVTYISDCTFDECRSLYTVEIPDSVISIGDSAFKACMSLTNIEIPESITSIGEGAFMACTNLSSIQFEGTIAQWEAVDKGRNWDYNTGNFTVYCKDTIKSYLTNSSFETGDLTGWTLTDLANAEELYVENKPEDSLTGDCHIHFWSTETDSVEFTLEQQVTSMPEGFYKYSISIMGGDCGVTDIYAYVKVNGQAIRSEPMTINGYDNWDTASITGIEYHEGDSVAVGIYVKCQGEGSGAWGKIDDAMFVSDQ